MSRIEKDYLINSIGNNFLIVSNYFCNMILILRTKITLFSSKLKESIIFLIETKNTDDFFLISRD